MSSTAAGPSSIRIGEPVAEEDVLEAVYDERSDKNRNRLRQLQWDTNNALAAADLPLEITRTRGAKGAGGARGRYLSLGLRPEE